MYLMRDATLCCLCVPVSVTPRLLIKYIRVGKTVAGKQFMCVDSSGVRARH